MVSEEVLEAADRLDIQPRGQRWRSVSYGVVDAVWSIGARYDFVVAPLVRRVAVACGDEQPLIPDVDAPGVDPTPLPAFRARFSCPGELLAVVENTQRTSTRGGIAKTEAVLRYVDTLLEHGVTDLATAQALLTDQTAQSALTAGLRRIPGRGVREGYFWMLVGADDVVKPDRQVLRWLRENGMVTTVDGARAILADIAMHLSERRGVEITPWQVDNAIWRSVARSTTGR